MRFVDACYLLCHIVVPVIHCTESYIVYFTSPFAPNTKHIIYCSDAILIVNSHFGKYGLVRQHTPR